MAVPTRDPRAHDGLHRRLDAWTREGLITREEADAISTYEARRVPRPAPAPPRVAPVAEALAYLGAALAAAALGILMGRTWSDLAVPARVAIPGVLWAALFAGGVVLRDAREPAIVRLASVLWLASTGALVWCVMTLVLDGFDVDDRWPLMWAGATATVYAGALYFQRPSGLQQLAFFGSLMLLGGGTFFEHASAYGIAVWALGIAWILLGWRGRLAEQPTALTIGTIGALVGSMIAPADLPDVGRWLGVATAVGLIGAAVALRSTPMLALAAIGLFQSTIGTVQYYFGGGIGAAIGLLIAGVLILVLAVVVARFKPTHWHRPGSARAAPG